MSDSTGLMGVGVLWVIASNTSAHTVMHWACMAFAIMFFALSVWSMCLEKKEE